MAARAPEGLSLTQRVLPAPDRMAARAETGYGMGRPLYIGMTFTTQEVALP